MTKVEWHIPSQEKAGLVQQLLRENRIKHVNVVYLPIGGCLEGGYLSFYWQDRAQTLGDYLIFCSRIID
jgi:hypothetical protein